MRYQRRLGHFCFMYKTVFKMSIIIISYIVIIYFYNNYKTKPEPAKSRVLKIGYYINQEIDV